MMEQNPGETSPPSIPQVSLLVCLLLLLLLIPLTLSNHPAGTVSGYFVLAAVLFSTGYLLLSILSKLSTDIHFVLSPVLGLALITTAYDVFAQATWSAGFCYLLAVFLVVGSIYFVGELPRPLCSVWSKDDYATVATATVAALSIAPLFWRSGRFSNGEFVFYGPAGQDHLFHVTLLQRLMHHVPPDNFIFSGLSATVYHYFGDLVQELILRLQTILHLPKTDLFDLYYRCYPTVFYFLLGALAYLAGRQLVGTIRGGVLSTFLLLGAGGLGWALGAMRTASHSRLGTWRAALFSTWTVWDGIDAIRALVHRPAHYHGLLICLAAINLLLRPSRTRRDWILAGSLLGLMAGFNYTLAATFGIATVVGSLLAFLQRRKNIGIDLAVLAAFLFIGSLPVNIRMLRAGFHNMAPGFPFHGPTLEFATATWGELFGRILPQGVVPLSALFFLLLTAYGIKLLGLPSLASFSLGEERHRGLATFLAIAFALSFVIGMFFPYKGMGGSIIFLQPTIWILALFSIRPISAWLEGGGRYWRTATLWGILALTWMQAMASFNFSSQAVFSREAYRALQELHNTASTDDVVAYVPSEITQRPVWGEVEESTNFSIMAMTGLDGYFSSDVYSKFSAVPGIKGRSPGEILDTANRLYERRRDDIGAFLKGQISRAGMMRLAQDRVRWIVVSGEALQSVSSPAVPWRRTPEMVIFHVGK